MSSRARGNPTATPIVADAVDLWDGGIDWKFDVAGSVKEAVGCEDVVSREVDVDDMKTDDVDEDVDKNVDDAVDEAIDEAVDEDVQLKVASPGCIRETPPNTKGSVKLFVAHGFRVVPSAQL